MPAGTILIAIYWKTISSCIQTNHDSLRRPFRSGDRSHRSCSYVAPGIKMLLVSLLIAVLALGLFVYALGMAGMAQGNEAPPQVKQFPLAISMLGFGLSSLLFWLAFLQLARTTR